MKKKILAILLLCAMVITLLPAVKAEADGIAFLYNKKNKTVMLDEDSTTNIYVGGSRVGLKYYISGEDSVSGKWKSSDTSVVKVSQKGSCKAVGNGYADITFTYKEDGKTKTLTTRLKSMTKATAVTIAPASALGGNLKVGETSQFTSTLTTNPKALKVNSSIKSTYNTYYYLYKDAACTQKADGTIAVVEQNTGKVTAIGAGTVYLRAEAKVSANSKSGVVKSNILPVIVASPVVAVQSAYNELTVTAKTEIASVLVQDAKTNSVITSTLKLDTTKKIATVSTGNTPLSGQYIITVNGKDTTTVTCQFTTAVKQTDSNKFSVVAAADILSVIVKNTKTGSIVNSALALDTTKKNAVVTTVTSPLVGDYTVIVSTADGKAQNFNIACQESTLTNIELVSPHAVLDKLVVSGSTYPKAYVYYKLTDQFGNDVTKSALYPTSKFIAIWDNVGVATITEQGVIELDFATQKLVQPVIGTAYSVTLIYGGATNVKLNATVTLGEPASVGSLKLGGIYTYVNSVEGYRKMADAEMNNITTGTTVVPYNSSLIMPGAYYLMIEAKDQYGNTIARTGVSESTIALFMDGGTNLKLAATSSIGTATIDGVTYLVYPLTAGTTGKTATGTTNIVISGGTAAPQVVQLKVAETAGIQSFRIDGTANIKKSGNAYAGVKTYVNYVVLNTAGNTVTDYDTLVALTNATSVTSAGTKIAYLYNQAILYSPDNSTFYWEEQADGSAKLCYTPMVTTLVTNTGINMVGIDNITTLKGTANESANNNIIIYVIEE